MDTREQMQTALATARTVRSEFDTHKVDAIDRVLLHLYSVMGACGTEAKAIKRDGEIADGNIDAAVEQLSTAIASFRNVQDGIRQKDDEIEDMVRTLADDEVWK